MRYTVYQTTNLVNGKIYIGKHQTINPNDSYLGSGRAIAKALKIHGRSNFKKDVLFDFDDEASMNLKEAELVTEEFVSRRDTYNLGVGGEGGAHFKGKKHSIETKAKLALLWRPASAATRAILSTKRHTQETKDKIALAASKRRLSDESKLKISNTLKSKQLLNRGVNVD
jgi:group I intron endonuclease